MRTTYRLAIEPTRSYRLFRYKLHRKRKQRFVRIRMKDRSILWIDLQDRMLGKYFFLNRDYETFETGLIEALIDPGMVVVDIGANVGYYTTKFAKAVGSSGRIYAFEPDEDNYQLLKRNIQENHLSNVRCENMAVSDTDGDIDFYLSDINFGDHRTFLSSDDRVSNWGNSRKTKKVASVTLDNYLDGQRVDLIKMDIQGAEVIALKGMEKTLADRDIVLFSEFWPHGLRESGHTPEQFLELLTEQGMRVYVINEETETVTPFDAHIIPELMRLTESDFSAHVNIIGTRSERISHVLSN